MDFHGLLYAAHKNDVSKEKGGGRYYKSTFAPPKKEEKCKGGLSVNVKKFLARKEEEEKRRKLEEEKKKDALLQLRNQDNKAKKRVQVMLKRTKSYNKSVIEDAIDDVNTADTVNGPQQCDEDDYGYVSQEASALYKKMMEKYGSVAPDERKVFKNNKSSAGDLLNTKDRVKMALQRQEEEELGPHKRKRKKKHEDEKEEKEETHEVEEESRRSPERERNHSKEKEEKPKPRRPAAPPPLDFTELLKIAEKKQYEPPPLEVKLKEKRLQMKEPERLMTKKEKMEYERTRDKRLDKEQGSSATDDRRERPGGSRGAEKNRTDHERERAKEKERRQQKEQSDRQESEKQREEERRRQLKEQKAREEERARRQKEAEREQERERQREREQRREQERDQERRREEGRIRQREQERERIQQREQDRERRREQERERIQQREQERERIQQQEQERERIQQREQEKERRREQERERIQQREQERERIQYEREQDRRREEERRRERERDALPEKKKLPSIPKKSSDDRGSSSRPLSPVGKSSLKTSSNFASKQNHQLKSIKREDVSGKVSKYPNDKASSSKSLDRDKSDDLKKKLSEKKGLIKNLFGDRDSPSPEKYIPQMKPDKEKPSRPVERIKISGTSTTNLDDLFGDDVTIRTKTKPVPNKMNSSLKPNDKVPPDTKSLQSRPKPTPEDFRKPRMPYPNERKRPLETNGRPDLDKRPKLSDSRSSDGRGGLANGSRMSAGAGSSRPPMKAREFPPKDMKSRQFPPPDVRSRQFPPSDVRARQFPPSDVRSRQFPPSDVARNSASQRRHEYERADSGDSSDEDEDDEYDSELDDFIDDAPAEGEDYSKYIRDIFGYDKSRYANIDDEDDECMESNFAQVMCEEKRSARIGLLEDIEDIRQEQVEKRLKALKKVKKTKR